MDWKKLLSTKRIGRTGAPDDAPPPRTEFTRDYDRIIFSSAFRRLQDKTQVFPLAKSDYVRTRLTHSLEVASVGRSLGMLAADVIERKQPEFKELALPHDIGTIVATACLAHDIGNPPFGHAGESAIQEWFTSRKPAEGVSDSERLDVLKFEGNAQGFRTLCSLQQAPQPGGLQLTYAVLGAFTKYPRASVVDEEQRKGISGKKFGFMQSEAKLFETLADEVGLVRKPGTAAAWHRHPLAFLVEAADDICYHVMDVEDGYKAGCLSFEEIEALHRPWLTSTQRDRGLTIAEVGRRAEYFRAVSVNAMVRAIVQAFDDHYDGLMNGTFDEELASNIPLSKELKAFKELAKRKVYSDRRVVEIEACGFEVIAGLLTSFVDAIEIKANDARAGANKARTLLGLMPKPLVELNEMNPYERMLFATDFVSGMTDSFAVDLYQRIRGISLP
ncbi:MAG: deoxyguanosinetriphosphate triphosphohydrolase [Burkholderiales bacterium]|nr:deoxyguanosinetriphosphate triphosphohydrolase [Burkholderiales bacterium]